MNCRRFILLIPLLFCLAACAVVTDRTSSPVTTAGPAGDGADLAVRCKNINRNLVSSRGIGRLEFTSAGRTQRLRFAWVGEFPDKLRVVLLGLDGRPMVTAAADGGGIYLLEHTTGKFHRESPPGRWLKAYLNLPLDLDTLARLLAGRMPAFDYDRAERIEGRTPAENGIVLKKWRNRVGRVYLDALHPTFTRVEAYTQTGALRYRADIKKTRKVKDFTVPRTLAIQDGDARRLVLDIERYRVNEPVLPETFRLEPPKG